MIRHGPRIILALAVTGVIAYIVAWWADPTR